MSRAVDLTVVDTYTEEFNGAAVNGPNNTETFDEQPYGLYFFSFAGIRLFEGTAVTWVLTGCGLTWTLIDTATWSGSSIPYNGALWCAVGVLKRGPLIIENANPASTERLVAFGYTLSRIRNAPMGNNGADAVVQKWGVNISGGPGAISSGTATNPIGNKRNMTFCYGGAHSGFIDAVWPMVKVFDGPRDWGHVAEAYAVAAGRAIRTARFATTSFNGSMRCIEVGTAEQPWLRQKQRSDL